MNKKMRIIILFAVDMLIVWLSIYTSYWFRFEGGIPALYEAQMLYYALISTVTIGLSMYYFRMYQRVWQYASISEIIALLKAIAIGSAAAYILIAHLFGSPVPLSIVARNFQTTLLLVGGIRFAWRILRMYGIGSKYAGEQSRVIIVGAGDCGTLIARELMSPAFTNWHLVGFIDDDVQKRNMRVLGLPILGNRYTLYSIVKRLKVSEIIIAMPSAPKQEVSEIINFALTTRAKVKIIPAINDLITGKVSVKAIRDVSVEDLLGREPVLTDLQGITGYVQHKVVLVTGAGGSIGSELCRQLAAFAPDKLLLLGHGENSIYTIELEMRTRYPWIELGTIIADIQDRARMEEIFASHRPQVVFHAAAHKHVPLMERNPCEAVKNNVFGTKNVADCADKFGVERFVLISSDKAVNPTSVMGATKRIAEMYIQTLDASSGTKFTAVRFGNVLGSRGSVIPRFKQQIAAGGPVTVTHPDMVRYFMTIPEAVQLVIQAGSLANGGEIFVLDMGKPVKILALAEDLIRLSGFQPHVDIKIEFSGIREGEKLFEEMLTAEEAVDSTQHNRIYIGKPSHINRQELELELKRLEKVLSDDQGAVKAVIETIVPMYEEVS